MISTAFGAVEYAQRGAGQPLLISHGIFHGCDGGLVAARDVADDRPSRFGYPGSDLPVNATRRGCGYAPVGDAFAPP